LAEQSILPDDAFSAVGDEHGFDDGTEMAELWAVTDDPLWDGLWTMVISQASCHNY